MCLKNDIQLDIHSQCFITATNKKVFSPLTIVLVIILDKTACNFVQTLKR